MISSEWAESNVRNARGGNSESKEILLQEKDV